MNEDRNFLISRGEGYSCEYGTPKYFILCGFGGVFSCGVTHTLFTPLDVVKCRIQVNPETYFSLRQGLPLLYAREGVRGLYLGWAPTFIGYSSQGACKFGCYETFKYIYARVLGEERAYLWRTYMYLAASASAEFIADVALCPVEAVKVRMQTRPGYASTMRQAIPKIFAEEGLHGFFKGLIPLWLRQIPYTMMKFATFERVLEFLYKNVVKSPRDQCSYGRQLLVTFSAGYIAGVLCGVVSHPADTLVSQMNKQKGTAVGVILQRIGFRGLWKGLKVRIFMIGTFTGVEWFIYDGYKVYTRLPRPPPPEIPDSLRK